MAAEPPSLTDLFTGTSYRYVERLDAGGMGEVFLVKNRDIGRKFVAKVMRKELAAYPQIVDRMRLEAQTLGRLRHVNIVAIRDFGKTADGRPFLVMEYLQGRSLRAELAQRGRIPINEAVLITCELLDALAAGHDLGMVHRDIKPDNIFLAEIPNAGRVVKLLDFGVVRILPTAAPRAPLPLSVPTETGTIIGTPRYASPEAAVGARVDTRADLYGAALVLYGMLAGRGPFDHLERDQDFLSAHALDDPPPPSSFAKEPVPAELDRLVGKALAKHPDARFQTAAEFRTELDKVLEMLTRPPGWLDTTAFNANELALAEPLPPLAAVPLPEVAADFGVPLTDAEGPDSRRRVARVFVLGLLGTMLIAGGIAWFFIAR
jgi:serine/threonine protein kinase